MANPVERFGTITVGSTVRLRIFVYNGNQLADVASIDAVNVYVCDPELVCMENPTGKTLVTTIDPSLVIHSCTGTYYTDLVLDDPQFVVGNFLDDWTMTVDPNLPQQTVQYGFKIVPSSWYSSPTPIVYDFSFDFAPNKIRFGSKQYIKVQVTPNVTKGSDLARYYEGLAATGCVTMTVCAKCGPCLPTDSDLNTVVENQSPSYTENCLSFFVIDTTGDDYAPGVYELTFQLELGGNTYLSDALNLLIFN